MKYSFQLRRGWKWDKDPQTGFPRDDWAEYETKINHQIPLEGELVLEYDNGVPRLKIGDGTSEFSALPYISVDSFILPTHAYVRLGTEWTQDADYRYYQVVKVENATITPNSKVDLQPDATQLSVFREKDLAFVAENEDGIVRVYCVGQVPKNEYKIQVTVTEVSANV